jgi:cytochrome c553
VITRRGLLVKRWRLSVGICAGALLVAATPLPIAGFDWLYPGLPGALPSAVEGARIVAVPGSMVRATNAELHDLTRVVDWFPESHGAAPAIVMQAQSADGFACGFCHLAGGEGRPENASLAGLPEAYIITQTQAFRGASRTSAHAGWSPSVLMTRAVSHATDADIAAAARYFSAQKFASRVTVVETPTVPATRTLGFLLAPTDGPREPIAGRIIEVPDDVVAFESRDPRSRFTAFVPPGSIARGAAVAERVGCVECHSSMMGNWGPGRSPSYILRQLLAFKTGARADGAAAPMLAVVADLPTADMVDVAAWYAAQPVPE